MEFSRPEYWSGLPFIIPRDLPDLGIGPEFCALQADSFTIWATREAQCVRHSVVSDSAIPWVLSPPGYSGHGILQAITLEWAACKLVSVYERITWVVLLIVLEKGTILAEWNNSLDIPCGLTGVRNIHGTLLLGLLAKVKCRNVHGTERQPFVEVLRVVLCPIQRLTEMSSPGIPVTWNFWKIRSFSKIKTKSINTGYSEPKSSFKKSYNTPQQCFPVSLQTLPCFHV